MNAGPVYNTVYYMFSLIFYTGCNHFGSFLLFRSIPLPKTNQVYFPERSRSPRVAELHTLIVAAVDSVLLGCIQLVLGHYGTLTVW